MSDTVKRRSVVKNIAAAGVAITASSQHSNAFAQAAKPQTRHVLVGCGIRSRMYTDAIWGDHKANNVLAGVLDVNPGRMNLLAKRAKERGATPPSLYGASQFDQMIRETKAQNLIVTTPDASHDDYIVRALDAGLDVMTEKPMTTTAKKAQRIIDAAKRNNRRVRVCFNYRYSPPRSQVKQLLMDGVIGDILSVDFHWLLNTEHGADYFHRWHSKKDISGGLMIHKATHHFDLVNWWLSAIPVQIHAYGKKEFYTPAMARRFGLSGPHKRCLDCPEKKACGFYLDLASNGTLKSLYLDNEHHDGYFRDQCVWREEIDIEDTMNVIVAYDTGATLSYSLNACNSWEGYTIAFNGTKGRLEHSIVESAGTSGAKIIQSESERVKIRIVPLRGDAIDIEPASGQGSHGGGDTVLLADLFGATVQEDTLMRAADERSGAYSMLVGAAANQCFKTGGPVRIESLIRDLKRPQFPKMPSKLDRLPMPGRS